jgi:YbbR domain-containing protein
MALIVFSVVLALLLWIYANNERNPVNDQILSIRLNQYGLGEGFVVNGIPSNVSIRVQGARTQITTLTPADFEAVVDLSKVAEGDHYIPVKVNSPPGIQVVQVTPSKVRAAVESIIEQQVNVSAALKGNPAKGYSALEPVVHPATVTVKGPRSKVNSLNPVIVTVDVESANGVVEQTVPVNLAQSGLSVFPQSVRVTVPVTPLPAKTVAVKARTTGEPAEGYEVSGITVNPANIYVTAPSGVITGINSVETEMVDINNVERDVTVRIGIIPPPGAVDLKPVSVEVTVNIRKTKDQNPGGGGTGTNEDATG